MVTKAFEGTDVGVEKDMFSGETRKVVVEGKGKDRQADLFDHGKLEQMRKEARKQEAPKSLTGETSTASGPDMDKDYQFKYRIMDLGDVIASHTTAMAPNPKYTSELQPRVRDRAASRLQVEKIAKGLKPKALLVDVEALDRGPMIIGSDNMVESGNGRVIALKIAANEHPENFAEYRAGLIHRAKKYGFDPDQVATMKQPVLVRERTTKVDRKVFVAEANQMAVMAMSPYEQAIQDSKNIKDSTLASLTVSESQSIDQALLSAANRPLAREFADSLPNNERAAIQDDKGGLNQTGLQRLKAALFAKTYPGEAGRRLTKTFFESLDPTVKTIENGLFASLPSIAKSQGLIKAGERYSDLSISEDLSKSVDMLARLKETGLDPHKYVAQATMLDRELTPSQEQLLLFLHSIGRSSKKVREFAQEYGEKVENSPHPQQSSMFGAGERVKKGDILGQLTGQQFDKGTGSGAGGTRLEEPGKGSGSAKESESKSKPKADNQPGLTRKHKPLQYTSYNGDRDLSAKTYLEYKGYKIAKEFDRAYNIVDEDNQTVSTMAGINGAIKRIDEGNIPKPKNNFYIEAALKQRYPGLQYDWWRSSGNFLTGPFIQVRFKGGGGLKPDPKSLLKEGQEIVDNGAPNRLLNVRMSDIDFEKATRAHSGTSFTPDDRGRLRQSDYVQYMNSLQDELMGKIPESEWPKLKETLKEFQQEYIKRKEGLLAQHSNIVSSMIAGPSNFPVRQMEKKNRSYDKRLNETLDWNKKAVNRIKQDFGLIKPKVSELKDSSKLEDMIATAEKTQETMISANKILRNKKLSDEDKKAKLIEVGIGPGHAAELLRPDYAGRSGFAQFHLTSNREKIKRWKAKLETLSKPTAAEIVFDGGTIVDNPEANRTQILFDSKPDKDIRDQLKRNGFKWSPKAGVWQRQRSSIAVFKAKQVVGLDPMASTPPDLPHLPNPADTDKEKNVVFGATHDTRSDNTIAEDMHTNQPLASQKDWVPSKTDLPGWDTTDIKEHQETYEQVFDKVKGSLDKSFEDDKVEGRVKTLPSIVKKLKKKNRDNGPFTHNNMEDIAGMRITFDSIDDLKVGVKTVKGKYKVLENEDYITKPKPGGYRSHHLTIEQNGKPVELQFRTPNMTTWGEWTHNTLYDHTDVTKTKVGNSGFKQLQDYAQAMSDYYEAKDAGKDPVMPNAPAVVSKVGGPMDTRFPKPQKAKYPATTVKGERQPAIGVPEVFIKQHDKTQQSIITDPVKVQKIKNSIAEGTMLLKSGRERDGSKRSPEALGAIRKQIIKDKAKIGDTSDTPQSQQDKPVRVVKVETKAATPSKKVVVVSSARKNGRWPVEAVTQAAIDRVQGRRTKRALAMDESRTGKNVRSRDNAGPWKRHPDRYDLQGVDTYKPKNQRVAQRTNRNGVIKRGRKGKRTPGVLHK